MKCKSIIAVVVIVLTVLVACQKIQLPFQKGQQLKTYIEKAQEYESQGKYVEALEQYKLAETITPDQPEIGDNVKRLENKLVNLAQAHYRAGLRFRDRGKWQLARKEFLQALRYDPAHKQAAAMLQQRPPDDSVKYIYHVIKPGESLSKLSIRYYGDYRKYHHIANFNNLSNATRVRVGQQIMIPAITGVSVDDLRRIQAGDASRQPVTDPSPVAPPDVSEAINQLPTDRVPPVADAPVFPPEMPDAPDLEQTEAVVDQVAEYRETGITLFNEKKYDDALIELQKVLSAEPEDAEATRYISRSYLELGRGRLAVQQIDEAKQALTKALEYDKDCQDCLNLLDECRRFEAKVLRIEAEKLIRGKQFDAATATLERALALNPDDETASDLLFQSHYQKALDLYDDGQYLEAKTGFEAAAAVNPDCEDCGQFIEDSLDTYKEQHYNDGIVYFGQEKLKQAISSWEKVIAVDPDYKDVQMNLKKATLLNERLEQIRQQIGE